MIDRRLQSLKDVPVPPASADAKARALEAALKAYATQPPVGAEPRTGPRPFVLRHGYKIAASLAALAVIGPMLALWRAPPATHDEAAKSKPSAPPMAVSREARPFSSPPAASPGAAPGAITEATPPVVARAPFGPAQQAAESAARRSQADAAAPEPAQPRALAAPPPPAPSAAPVTSAPAMKPAAPQAMRSAKASRPPPAPALATLAATIDAGRLPAPADVDPAALVNAVDYPSARATPPAPVSIVPAPWSGAPIAFATAARPAASDPALRLDVQCGDRPWQPARSLLTPAERPAESAAASARRPAAAPIVGLFQPGDAATGCSASVLARAWAGDTPSADAVRIQSFAALADASDDVRFAVSLLRFVDLLRGSAENATAFGFDATIALAEGARGPDPSDDRAALVALMRKAATLKK